MDDNKRQFHASVLTYLSMIGIGFLTGLAGAYLKANVITMLGFMATAASGLVLSTVILRDIFYKLLGRINPPHEISRADRK